MLKIIDRYILRELFKIFILAIVTLTSVMFLDKILYLTDMIFSKGVPVLTVLMLFVYVSPAFLVLTIPMSILVASLIVFNRLSADSELVVLNVSGYSFGKLFKPVAILSVVAYLLANFLMIYALPWGNHSFKQAIFKILKSAATIEIKERIFNNDFENLLIYVNENSKESNLMKGIFISDSRDKGELKVISAKEGIITSSPDKISLSFRLKDGAIHNTVTGSDKYRLLNFSTYTIQLNASNNKLLDNNDEKMLKGNREMSIKEIREKIAYLKSNNMTYFGELVEFHKKFSIPFTCLILGFIGAPLGIKSSRSGKSGGIALSLGIILFYYIALITGESVGDAGKVSPMLAMWMPNFIIFIAGVFLVIKVQKR